MIKSEISIGWIALILLIIEFVLDVILPMISVDFVESVDVMLFWEFVTSVFVETRSIAFFSVVYVFDKSVLVESVSIAFLSVVWVFVKSVFVGTLETADVIVF